MASPTMEGSDASYTPAERELTQLLVTELLAYVKTPNFMVHELTIY
jgi:hypothetical protein